MKSTARLACTVGLALFLSGAASAQTEEIGIWKEDVLGWVIGIDRSTKNGCFMMKTYDDGTTMRFQTNPELGNALFIIGNVAWASLEYGKNYKIAIKFGSESPWESESAAFDSAGEPSLATKIDWEDNKVETFIEEMSKASTVLVTYDGNEIANLELRDSRTAVGEVYICQDAMIKENEAKAKDPFVAAQEPKKDPFK